MTGAPTHFVALIAVRHTINFRKNLQGIGKKYEYEEQHASGFACDDSEVL
jgi:hypothetical protein